MSNNSKTRLRLPEQKEEEEKNTREETRTQTTYTHEPQQPVFFPSLFTFVSIDRVHAEIISIPI